MIPPFDDNGQLPPGTHQATIAEIDVRFGRSSEIRRTQMDSLRWLIDLAARAGVMRIILNGSFVTDIIEPNDVDCVLLAGPEYPKDGAAADEILVGLPFVDAKIVRRRRFDEYAHVIFARDRFGELKGVIEVIL